MKPQLIDAVLCPTARRFAAHVAGPIAGVLAFIAVGQSSTSGATIHAAGASAEDVQAAINTAVTGDTVVVQAATVMWESTVNVVGKDITLQGAGIGESEITSDVLAIDLSKTRSRVTGFTFVPAADRESIVAWGQGWRIDHCRFEAGLFGDGVLVRGNNDGRSAGEPPHGLIDNCEFLNRRILVYGDATLLAHTQWNQPTRLGTDEAVYVEDCTFDFTVFGNAMDANYGGKYVFRYNILTNVYIEAHSVQGTHRAARKWEIYGNTFLASISSSRTWVPMFLRGGTGVIFGNSVSGTWGDPIITFDVVRGFKSSGLGGLADGGSLWDGNEPVDDGAGIHTGQSVSPVLIDATKQWVPDAFVSNSIPKWVHNLTSRATGQITVNTENSLTAVMGGGNRSDWEPGDEYKITGGYPARDQIGRGQDAWLWTSDNPYPPQASEPVYIWDNFRAGQPVKVNIHNGAQVRFLIQEGRDYIFARRPDYLPYAYPHPLRAASDPTVEPPARPASLRVLPNP